LEVFSVPMHAAAAGDLSIASSPVSITPQYNTLEYGIDGAISISAIRYGKLSIHIADASPDQPPHETTIVPIVEPPGTPPETEAPSVSLSLTATTLEGLSIDNLHVGDNFTLHVWAQDTRTDARGVFAAYLNLNWDESLAAQIGSPAHADHFPNAKKDGDAAPGSLIRVGGVCDGLPTHSGLVEVFSVPMRAAAAGELSIATSSAADGTPLYWVLEHGFDGEIPLSDIQFGGLSIHIADASASQPPPGTIDTPALDPTNSPKNETPATSLAAIPTIVITAPTDSHGHSRLVFPGDQSCHRQQCNAGCRFPGFAPEAGL
jgi:hypothetical protein